MVFLQRILVNMKKGLLYKRRQEIIKSPPTQKEFVPSDNLDEVVCLLYAPGSNGLPDCSLGYALSSKAKPELRAYVEQHLLHSDQVQRSSCHDPDVALDTIVPIDMQLGRDRDAVGNYFLNMIKEGVSQKDD